MLMKANPERRTFELLDAAFGGTMHEPFEANVNVAEQFWHAVDVQLAQFDAQAWHPGTEAV
jgi:hypothetical protein